MAGEQFEGGTRKTENDFYSANLKIRKCCLIIFVKRKYRKFFSFPRVRLDLGRIYNFFTEKSWFSRLIPLYYTWDFSIFHIAASISISTKKERREKSFVDEKFRIRILIKHRGETKIDFQTIRKLIGTETHTNLDSQSSLLTSTANWDFSILQCNIHFYPDEGKNFVGEKFRTHFN